MVKLSSFSTYLAPSNSSIWQISVWFKLCVRSSSIRFNWNDWGNYSDSENDLRRHMHSYLHIGRLSHLRKDCYNGRWRIDDDNIMMTILWWWWWYNTDDDDEKVFMRDGIARERRHDSGISRHEILIVACGDPHLSWWWWWWEGIRIMMMRRRRRFMMKVVIKKIISRHEILIVAWGHPHLSWWWWW